jgi:ribonuclease J
MRSELAEESMLRGARLVWSMWAGYLDDDRGAELQRWAASHEIVIEVVHASGHAAVKDLQRLAAVIAARRIVPIHTDRPEEFAVLFDHVERHADGEWWEA